MTPPSSPNPPDLSVVQRWFQAVITHPGGVAAGAASSEARECFDQPVTDVASLITDSSRLDAESRLAVYADAYYARLIECLSEVFPMLRRTLGEEVFKDFAFDYLQSHPSRRYTLNVLGLQFPPFLAAHRPPRETDGAPDWADFIIELARFEWAMYVVFDGPGTEDLPNFDTTALMSLAPESIDSRRLQLAPCVHLFHADFPVSDFFTSARKSPPEADLETPEPAPLYLALSRRDYLVRRHPLSRAEFAALEVLRDGGTIGAALQQALALESVEPPQIQAWFARWAREGFFTGIQ